VAIKKILKVNNLILRSTGKKPFRAKIVEYFNNIMKDISNDLSTFLHLKLKVNSNLSSSHQPKK